MILACHVVVLGVVRPQTHLLPVTPLPALIKSLPSLVGTSWSPTAPQPEDPGSRRRTRYPPARRRQLPASRVATPSPCAPRALPRLLPMVLSSAPASSSLHTRLSLSAARSAPVPSAALRSRTLALRPSRPPLRGTGARPALRGGDSVPCVPCLPCVPCPASLSPRSAPSNTARRPPTLLALSPARSVGPTKERLAPVALTDVSPPAPNAQRVLVNARGASGSAELSPCDFLGCQSSLRTKANTWWLEDVGEMTSSLLSCVRVTV